MSFDLETEKLKEHIKNLQSIIDHSWDGIIIVDRNSKIVYVNNSFSMILGYPRDKILGAPFELFLKSEYHEKFEKLIKKIEKSNTQSFVKVICKSKDGHDISLNIALWVMDDDLVVLDAKELSSTTAVFKKDSSVSTTTHQKIQPKKEQKESTQEKHDDLLHKTIDWFSSANKAIDNLLSSNHKDTKSPTSMDTILTLVLPKEIDMMDKETVRKLVKDDVLTYESLGYVNFTYEQLAHAKEWHSWQVSVMLKMYKSGDKIFVPNKSEVFPQFIESQSKQALEHMILSMIANYRSRTNPLAKKSVLEKDIKWTALEVGHLLYYLLD